MHKNKGLQHSPLTYLEIDSIKYLQHGTIVRIKICCKVSAIVQGIDIRIQRCSICHAIFSLVCQVIAKIVCKINKIRKMSPASI